MTPDAALEIAISAARAQMEQAFAAGNMEAARQASDRLRHAVQARSAAQIERMEREKGLA